MCHSVSFPSFPFSGNLKREREITGRRSGNTARSRRSRRSEGSTPDADAREEPHVSLLYSRERRERVGYVLLPSRDYLVPVRPERKRERRERGVVA
jgi:hypothetical protein